MRRSLRSWRDAVRGPLAYVAGGIAVFGVWSEHVAVGLAEWRGWLLDATVGFTLLVSGVVAHRRSPGVGVLLMAAAAAWWVGNVVSTALFLHRGVLVVAVWTYPATRIRARSGVVLVVAGMLVTIPVLARSDPGTVMFGVVSLAGAAVRFVVAGGGRWRSRRFALQAATAVALGAIGAAALRQGDGDIVGSDVATLWYEVMIVVAGVILARGVRAQPTGAIADAVVELTANPRTSLRDRLADLLDDPDLVVAHRVAGEWVDDTGAPVVVSTDPSRVMTVMPGLQVALVHDLSIARDAALLGALESVTRLATQNAELDLEMRRVLDDLSASGRRLRDAEDEERRRLRTRLHGGVGRRLDAVGAHLAAAATAVRDQSVAMAIQRAIDQLERTRADLVVISDGLHPDDQADLTEVLASLVADLAVPVELRVPEATHRVAAEASLALSYCCAEAISNAIKHARANRIVVELSIDEATVALAVTDDGVGGADAACGSGLRGLCDRAVALGGTLEVESAPGAGTRLTVTLPRKPALVSTAEGAPA